MKTLLLLLTLVLLFLTVEARAQTVYSDYASIGPRVTYNFGEGGGWKFGFEVAYFPRVSSDAKFVYGLTTDLLFQSAQAFTLHLGIETPAGIGLDIGPSFTFMNQTVYPAFTMIIFGGLIIYPAFEWTMYFSSLRNYTSLGFYLKWPVGNGFQQRYLNGFG